MSREARAQPWLGARSIRDSTHRYAGVEILINLPQRGVALAGFLLQTRRIHDVDAAPALADEAFALQQTCGGRDRGSPRSQHHREEFLGQVKRVAFDSITNHQEPARQSLFGFVQAVTGGKLAKDSSLALHALQNAFVQLLVFVELLLQFLEGHSQSSAFDLHKAARWNARVPQKMEALHYALLAPDAHFRAGAARHRAHDRSDARGHEVRENGEFVRLV